MFNSKNLGIFMIITWQYRTRIATEFYSLKNCISFLYYVILFQYFNSFNCIFRNIYFSKSYGKESEANSLYIRNLHFQYAVIIFENYRIF